MPSLGYWKIRGLAQPIRLLLNYVGEDFDDVQYEVGDGPEFSREAWMGVKQSFGLDFPNLPYYIDGDVKLTQSNAILKYIGRKHNLLGESDKEKAIVDMLLDQVMDLRNGLVRLAYNPQYEEIKGDYFKGLPAKLALFEKLLDGRDWLAGSKITVADFHLYEMLDEHKIMNSDTLKDFPKLKAYTQRFEALPAIKTYMASDKFLKRPLNNKSAAFK